VIYATLKVIFAGRATVVSDGKQKPSIWQRNSTDYDGQAIEGYTDEQVSYAQKMTEVRSDTNEMSQSESHGGLGYEAERHAATMKLQNKSM